jgi:hypothetical protein
MISLYVNIKPVFSTSPHLPLLVQAPRQIALDWLNKSLQAIQESRVQDGITAFRQATQLDPTLAAAHYNLG